MHLKKLILFILIFGSINSSVAQDYWDLRKCIEYAFENNIFLQQSLLNVQLSEQNLKQNQSGNLPNVNGFGTNTWNFGQTIDPLTNSFATSKVRSNQFGVRASMVLFAGMSNTNTSKSSQFSLEASKQDLEKARNDIALTIAATYLNILLQQELVYNSKMQINQTKKQVDRTSILVDAGTLAQGNLLDMKSQLALEELQLVNAQNQLDLSLLQLKQLLQLNQIEEFRVVNPNIELGENESIESRPGQIYDKALSLMPQVKSAEFRLLSAEKNVSIAKSGYSPSLSLNATIGTGYSGARKDFNKPTITSSEPITLPYITESGDQIYGTDYSIEYPIVPFGNQLSDNLNQSVGFTLTIPIFNQFGNSTNISRSKINYEQQMLTLKQVKQDLNQEIQAAYQDAQAALKKYKASKKAVDAMELSYQYMKDRFDVGLINSIDFSDAKNRLTKAQSDLKQAKYEYIFTVKKLDLYQGKEISL